MQQEIRKAGIYKEISSLTNPIIKDIKGLTQRKNRQSSKRFLVEGLKLVASALDTDFRLDIFVFGKKVADHELVQKIAARTKAHGGMVLEVSQQVLSKITRRDNPQMVLGIFQQPYFDKSLIQAKERDLWVALEGVKDPGNLGTIIRTADAAGVKGLILVGETTDPFALETTRATMGSIFALPIIRFQEDAFTKFCQNWKGMLVGTHLEGAVDYRTLDYNKPTILFMGNEQSGLPDNLAQCCSDLVKIPQKGQADSLNLAIATGIMLFEIQRDILKF